MPSLKPIEVGTAVNIIQRCVNVFDLSVMHPHSMHAMQRPELSRTAIAADIQDCVMVEHRRWNVDVGLSICKSLLCLCSVLLMHLHDRMLCF